MSGPHGAPAATPEGGGAPAAGSADRRRGSRRHPRQTRANTSPSTPTSTSTSGGRDPPPPRPHAATPVPLRWNARARLARQAVGHSSEDGRTRQTGRGSPDAADHPQSGARRPARDAPARRLRGLRHQRRGRARHRRLPLHAVHPGRGAAALRAGAAQQAVRCRWPTTRSRAAVFTTTITSQAKARNVRTALIGGLYNDLAPLADDVRRRERAAARPRAARATPNEILKLTTLGGTTPKFVPWMQATYILAVNKQALQWLPAGADVRELTYDQYLAWARAAQAASGPPGLRDPRGPEGPLLPLHPGLPAAQLHRRAGDDVPRRRRRGRVDVHGAALGGHRTRVHQLRVHAGAAGPRRGAGGVGPRRAAHRRHEGQARRLADGARPARAERAAATCSSSRAWRCRRAASSGPPPSR